MGTRADFYIAESLDDADSFTWLGSVSYDGDPDRKPRLFDATSKNDYIAATKYYLDHPMAGGVYPEEGWPWPWEDSQISDFAYVWIENGEPSTYPNIPEGTVYILTYVRLGHTKTKRWVDHENYELKFSDNDSVVSFEAHLPDMSSIKNVKGAGFMFVWGGP